MVRDLEAAGDLLADSDLVAAIAGDAEAQQLVVRRPTRDRSAAGRRPRGRLLRPRRRLLAAQRDRRRLAGRSLVIHGPPGTGKSQTIANLIAAMVARGRKVLFVAEKRAAIDAVLSRLVGVGLGDLVLDIHEGTRDRQRIAAGLGATLDLAEHARPRRTPPALHRRLTDRQRRLRRHSGGAAPGARAVAAVGLPGAVRAARRAAAGAGRRPAGRAGADHPRARRAGPRRAARVHPPRRLHAAPRQHPLVRRRRCAPASEAREAVDLAVTLSARTLPRLAARLAAACKETRPARRLLPVIAERARLTEPLRPHSTTRSRPAGLPRAARAAQARRAGGVDRAGAGGRRRGSGDSRGCQSGYRGAGRLAWREAGTAAVAALAALAPHGRRSARTRSRRRPRWRRDAETPWRLPRLHELARRFGALGLARLLDEIGSRRTGGPPPTVLVAAFDYAWYRAILDYIRVADPGYGAEYGVAARRDRRRVPPLATRSTWPPTAPGCAARGPGSCGTPSTSTRCRPG